MEVSGEKEDIFGMAHGGAVFSLVDEAFGAAANSHGTVVLALNVNITYVSPPFPGETLRATAVEVDRSETVSTCEIRVLGDGDRLIAAAQATGYRKKRSFLLELLKGDRISRSPIGRSPQSTSPRARPPGASSPG